MRQGHGKIADVRPAKTALIVGTIATSDDRSARRRNERLGGARGRNAPQALAHARSHDYDLAIVDLGLTDGDPWIWSPRLNSRSSRWSATSSSIGGGRGSRGSAGWPSRPRRVSPLRR